MKVFFPPGKCPEHTLWYSFGAKSFLPIQCIHVVRNFLFFENLWYNNSGFRFVLFVQRGTQQVVPPPRLLFTTNFSSQFSSISKPFRIYTCFIFLGFFSFFLRHSNCNKGFTPVCLPFRHLGYVIFPPKYHNYHNSPRTSFIAGMTQLRSGIFYGYSRRSFRSPFRCFVYD